MFKIILRLAIVCLIHIVLFSAYPETGKNGNLFLGISLFCWAALSIMISTVLRNISSLGSFLAFIIMLAFYCASIGSTAYLMPQADHVTVYDKLLKGNYPNYYTFERGLKRFGIHLDEVIDEAGEVIEEQKKELDKQRAENNEAAKVQHAQKKAGDNTTQVGEMSSK